MTDRTNYPAWRRFSLEDLSTIAVPVGERAVERTLALANDALLRCFPQRLRTPALAERFITRERLHPVPQAELAAQERAAKPSDCMAIFALILETGLPHGNAEELIYSVREQTGVYANIFRDKPELYIDEQAYQGFFSSDRTEREHAVCMLGRAVIDVNLAAAPSVRLLPSTPWQAVVEQAVESCLLPSFRHLLEETQTYDVDRFATLTSKIAAFFTADETNAPARPFDTDVLRLINSMMNTFFGDDEPVEAVPWEPQAQSRLIAHGAKVLFQRAHQVLPVFEFGTGITLDRETRTVFAREAVLAFYAKLQQQSRLRVVAHHERTLLGMMTPMPAAYLEMGVRRADVLEHYLRSDIPDWYRERMSAKDGNAEVYPQ